MLTIIILTCNTALLITTLYTLFKTRKDIKEMQNIVTQVRLYISTLVIPHLNESLSQNIEREDYKSAKEIKALLEHELNNVKKIMEEVNQKNFYK